MRLQYDPSVDAAYLFFSDDESRAAFDFTYPCDPEQVNGQIHLDFDIHGRLLGIEILHASTKLSSDVLGKAVIVPQIKPRKTVIE
jgi:uncharacterized protein YuzE